MNKNLGKDNSTCRPTSRETTRNTQARNKVDVKNREPEDREAALALAMTQMQGQPHGQVELPRQGQADEQHTQCP